MDIPKENFSTLIKDAIIIDEELTNNISTELKVNLDTLVAWSRGEDVPDENRLKIIHKISRVMMDELVEISKTMDGSSE